MLVINSISHDARVLKEADSLRNAGHAVTVVGIKDARNRQAHETRDSGVEIHRVSWRSHGYRRLAAACLLAAVLVVLAGVALFAMWPPGPAVQLASVVRSSWDHVWGLVEARGAGVLVPVLLVAFTTVLLVRRARRYLQLARRYRVLEEEEGGRRPAEAPSVWGTVRALMVIKYKVLTWRGPLGSVVRRAEPDVLHCHDVLALPLGARLKRRLGCRLAYDAHEIYEEVAQGTPELGAAYRSVQRRHQREVDLFITINESIADFYSSHYPKLPRAVVIKNAAIPSGPTRYDGRLHDAAGLPRHQKILLYQGGFATHRGLETLVQSARHLPSSWTLVLMGWGKLEGELRDLASSLLDIEAESATTLTQLVGARRLEDVHSPNSHMLEQRVEPAIVFVPPASQSELVCWTAGATLGVIPYEDVGLNHWFCTPNKLWEYPNAGVPMLVSEFPEMAKVVERYGLGWFLPHPLEPRAISDVIKRISDEDLASAAKACARFIEADNWTFYEARLTQAYASLLGHRSKALAGHYDRTQRPRDYA